MLTFKKWSPLVAAGCLALGAASAVRAAGTGDVLEVPAVESERAAISLLLDVDRAGERLVAVGERGHIIHSDDQGKTWTQAPVPVSLLLTALDFADERQGWAVGHGAVVLHSADGGVNWTKQFDGNIANVSVLEEARQVVADLEARLAEASDEEAPEIESALEEASFALDDAQVDSESGAAKPLLDVHFISPTEGFVVGAYGLFFQTQDGGKTWKNGAKRLDNPDRYHLNAINSTASGHLFIVGEAGQVFRSTDRGVNWERLESPYEGSLFGVTGTGRANEVMVFGLRGNAFRSSDNGQTWEPVDAGVTETLMAAAVGSNGELALVGNAGIMLLSRDHGQSFSAHPREDRMALGSALFLSSDRLVLVGEAGVSVIRGISQLN